MKPMNNKDKEFLNNFAFKKHSPFYLSALKLELDGKIFYEYLDLWIDTAIEIRNAVLIRKSPFKNENRMTRKKQIRKLYTRVIEENL